MKKKIATLVLLLLYCLPLVSVFIPLSQATSWLSGYGYRVPITISDPYSLAGDNYQIPIGVKYDGDVYSWSPDRYPENPFDLPGDDVGYGATHPTVMYFPVAVDGYSFWMWYEEGGSYTNETDVDVYLVRSNNGLSWVETGVSNPVLDTSEVTYGAHDPHVIWISNTDWRMWYGTRHSNGTFTIGYATSTDGKDFTIVNGLSLVGSEAWEDHGVYSPTIIYESSTFHMMYTGLNASFLTTGYPQIGYATSSDGNTWTKYASNPVLSPTDGSWEEDGIWHHNIVENNGNYMFVYNGYPAPTPAEGFGVAQSSNFISWTKSTYDPFMYITTDWEATRLYTPSPLRYASNQSLVFFNEGHGDFTYLYYSANTDTPGVLHKIGLAIEERLGYYNLNGYCQTDFDDVVFTSSDGATLLDHYTEMVNSSWSTTQNEWCIKWVEVPTNLNDSDATIYMYFGNPSASSSSSGDDTFLYFDDFLGDTLDADWVTSGTIEMSPTGDGGDTWVQFEDDDSIYSYTDFGFGHAVKTKSTTNNHDGALVRFVSSTDVVPSDWIDITTTDAVEVDFDDYHVRTGYDYPPDYTSLEGENCDTFNAPPWHTYEIQRNMTNNIIQYEQDDRNMQNITTFIPPDNLGVGMCVWDSSQESTLTCDWIFVRKFVSPEPTFTFGSREAVAISCTEGIITNMEGCGNWIFSSERYYHFKTTYTLGIGETQDSGQLAFSDLYQCGSLQFDGTNDFVTVSDDATLDFSGTDYSIMVWVWWDSSQGDSTGQIVNKGANYQLAVNNDGKVKWQFEHSVEGWQTITMDDPIDSEEWVHVVATYQEVGAVLSIYINGELNETDEMDGTSFWNTGDLTIGAYDVNTERFTGYLDELLIFSELKTPTEISNSYNDGIGLYEQTNLVNTELWFHFDEETGGTTYDRTTNNNDGTISSASWSTGKPLADPHWVITQYDLVEEEWKLLSGVEIVNLKMGSHETLDTLEIIIYDIWLEGTIIDKINVELYTWGNTTDGDTTLWVEIATDYVNIYNTGGLGTLETGGTAGLSGRILGGDVFELWSRENGVNTGWAMANVTYHNLQHVRFLVDLKVPNVYGLISLFSDNNPFLGYWCFGLDYCYQDTWMSGWYANITLIDIDLGTDDLYGTFNVSWYYEDTWVKTDTLAGFWWGEHNEINPGDGFSVWVDLWFNTINSSTTIGGRVQSEYYGISDADPWWKFWSSDWGVIPDFPFTSTYFDDFTVEGNIRSCKEVKLMRVWTKIHNFYPSSAPHNISIGTHGAFDKEIAEGEMMGVPTPPLEEPLLPDMPMSGFLAPLFSGFLRLLERLEGMFGATILKFWNVFVNFLDTVFTLANWPNGFSQILGWIESFFQFMIDGITYGLSLLSSTFTMMASWLTFGISRFTSIASGFVDIYNVLVDIWTQANDGWISISSWLTPLLPLLPLCIFVWIFSVKDTEGLVRRVTLLWSLVSTVILFLIKIGDFTIQTIYGLIELVPEVE